MSSSQAPDSSSVAQVIIPASVPASGPQFQTFPNEVLLEILKYLVALSPDAKVNQKYFDILNIFGPLHKLRKVSKNFAVLATAAFYEVNVFSLNGFETKDSNIDSGKYYEQTSCILPPLYVRSCLRRLQICLTIEDFFITMQPGGYNAPTNQPTSILNAITTVNQLLTHCPGARRLLTLTDNTTGFSGLRELDLHIYTDFRCGNPQAALAVMTAAGLSSVKVGKLRLSVSDRWGFSEDWHAQLVTLVGG